MFKSTWGAQQSTDQSGLSEIGQLASEGDDLYNLHTVRACTIQVARGTVSSVANLGSGAQLNPTCQMCLDLNEGLRVVQVSLPSRADVMMIAHLL